MAGNEVSVEKAFGYSTYLDLFEALILHTLVQSILIPR